MAGKQRRGLGRGLDALIGGGDESRDAGASSAGVTEVDVASIHPNPYQPRRDFDENELDDLAASIAAHGLIQPLIARRAEDGWTLIAGERRLRAARRAGLESVPVVERDADDQEMLAVAIIENVQRADLDPIESAEAFRRLMDEFELTQAEVATIVGKSRAAIANTVRLLGLSDDVRALVARGALSEGHGRALLGVSDHDAQLRMARRAIDGAWTVRDTERNVREVSSADNARSSPPAAVDGSEPTVAAVTADADTAAAARELEGVLGTPVEIRRKGDGGTLVLHFFSEEELGALYDRLIGNEPTG